MKRNPTLHIPRWFAKFILNETKTHPNNQQIFFAILEPMSPQEWCRIWIPIIHPDVEAPYPGERSPPGYMKASIMTLQQFIGACKNQQITIEQGLLELQQLQKEAQTQQKALGERFNLDEFFKQRIGTSPEELNPGSYHYDLYQLLLKSQSISQVGYALFREAFLRQTQDLIMNGTEASSINQNQIVAGFDKAFDAVETQFEQNFLGNSINWEEQEHLMLASSQKTALPSTQKTNTSTSPSSKK